MIKKTLLLVLILALVSCNIQEVIKSYRDKGYEILEHSQGHHQVRVSDELTHIFETGETILNSFNLRTSLFQKYKDVTSKDISDTLLSCSKGKKADYFKMLAWPIGVLGNDGKTQQTFLKVREDSCFKTVFANFEQTGSDSYTIDLIASDFRGGATCSDIIQIATSEVFHLPVILSFATKKHTIQVTNQSKSQMEAVNKWGIHIFQTCDKINNLLPDLRMTLELFIGGLSDNPEGEGIWNSRPTEQQVLKNIEFLFRGQDYEWQKRENPVLVDLDDTEVHSGDFIIINRFDGVDNIIQWGAGGHVGHTCVFLEMDGEMYVVESQDGWYWPRHGVQKNTWTQWKKWANDAAFNVAIIPLSEEKRQMFQENIDDAIQFYKSMEGYPYGYHNFLFGWLDDTDKNIPAITTIEYFWVLFCQLEKILPDVISTFLGEALNIRLGTKGLTLPEISNTIFDRGMTLQQVLNIPEQDSWVYSDGPSNVCSTFVTRIYKAAGLFEGVEVQGTEFTPRDICQLNFWNTQATLPEKCTKNDPNLPYCQVMGDYVLDITQDLWNTIKPYDNMFERCPSVAPLYERNTSYPNGC